MPKPVIYRLSVGGKWAFPSYQPSLISNLPVAQDRLLGQPGELGGGRGRVRWAPRSGRSRHTSPISRGNAFSDRRLSIESPLSLKQPPSKAFSFSPELPGDPVFHISPALSFLHKSHPLFSECRHFRTPCLLILLICSLSSRRNYSPTPPPKVIED